MLTEKFYDCLKHEGIVAVASANAEGQAHCVNTWNRYIIVTEDEKLLIPCFGFRKTEKNVVFNPHIEITIGSHEVMGRRSMGTGFLLTGTAEFQKEGPLFDRMRDLCSFTNRVMVFTPDSCKQTL